MKYVSYCRVSTEKQGLGLDAQKNIIAEYLRANGGTLIADFAEKESGKNANRAELIEAIRTARSNGAKLIVAKLDRLSRDISDIFTIRKNIDFIVCDMDAADTLTLGIFATLAQKERELISRRTKEALQALKNNGVKLGSPSATETIIAVQSRGWEARRNKANNAPENRHAYNAIRNMDGSLAQKAAFLNSENYRTRNGKEWTATAVLRLMRRFSQA